MDVGLVLVVSHAYERFVRARSILEQVGFQAVVYMPAVFVDERAGCRGNNGHRLAFRNMWQLVDRVDVSTCIFEDDIALTNTAFRADSVRFRTANELIFLGEFERRGRWWTNHAACLTPLTARILLNHTRECIEKKAVSIDHIMKKMCETRLIDCRKASDHRIVVKSLVWWGDFHQNRSIQSFLHDEKNRPKTFNKK